MQANTSPGRQLIDLRKQTDHAEEYRQVRVILEPGLTLPRYRLRVNLRTFYKARIGWEPEP